MTPFDYILLIATGLHFLLSMLGIWGTPPELRKYLVLKSSANIWWIAPLIVIYRVWG